MATLVIIGGPSEGRCHPLQSSRLVSVGRDDQCSFQLVDERVSRRHLQVRWSDEERRHYAVDMRSANGVYLNGARLSGESPLKEGDVLEIGGSKIRYTLKDFEDAEAAEAYYRKTDEWKKGTTF